MNELDQRRLDLMRQRKEYYPNPALTAEECPICGWHVSSHSVGTYGLDCPWGDSPAANKGLLMSRVSQSESDTDTH